MPTFEFTSPNGKKYEVTGPDGSTQEQAFTKLQEQLAPTASAPEAAPVAEPAQSFRSAPDQIARSIGLAARMGAQATAGTAGMVGDALNAGINKFLPPDRQLRSPSKLIQAGIDKVLPVPENTGEKIGDFAGTIAASGIRGGVDPLARAITSRFAAPAAGALGSERAATLAEAKPLGFVATPSTARGGPLSKLTEVIAGKSPLIANAATKNEEAYNAMARKVVGYPKGTPLNEETLNKTIKATYDDGYEPLKQIGQMTNGGVYRRALDAAKQEFQGASRDHPNEVREDIQKLIANFRTRTFTGDGAVHDLKYLADKASTAFKANDPQLAHATLAIKKAVEESIDLNLSTIAPKILPNFVSARKALAQQYMIRDAIKEGTGSIDPTKLRQALAADKPLTGELRTAAKFATAFPQISGIEKAAGGSTFGDRIPYSPTAMAVLGTTLFGPAGGIIAGAGTPFARAGLRKGMLTGPGQTLMNPKNLTPLERFLRRKSLVNAIPTTVNQSNGLFSDD